MRLIQCVMMCVAIVVLTSPGAAQQQTEPFMAVGTWKLNPAKSTGAAGSQLQSRSRIHTIEARGGGVTVNRIEQINADGSTQTSYFTCKADGTPYPIIAINSNGTTQVGSMTETRVDASTIKWAIANSEGKVTASGIRTVSKDGKTYTLSGGANGNALVYDRQ